jgi:hypothetical protein
MCTSKSPLSRRLPKGYISNYLRMHCAKACLYWELNNLKSSIARSLTLTRGGLDCFHITSPMNETFASHVATNQIVTVSSS